MSCRFMRSRKDSRPWRTGRWLSIQMLIIKVTGNLWVVCFFLWGEGGESIIELRSAYLLNYLKTDLDADQCHQLCQSIGVLIGKNMFSEYWTWSHNTNNINKHECIHSMNSVLTSKCSGGSCPTWATCLKKIKLVLRAANIT